MKDFFVVLDKEWRSFVGSDRGIFLVYVVLVLTWSYLITANEQSSMRMGPIWMVFFAVIVGANFSSTVFISERMNGTLEIMLTSGLSRDAVLFGKMVFVILMTLVLGIACLAFSFVWRPVWGILPSVQPFQFRDLLLFFAASFLNASSSAFLSVRLPNPRLLHFTNLFMLAAIISLYYATAPLYASNDMLLVGALLFIGGIFVFLSRREFHGERIIQPIVL